MNQRRRSLLVTGGAGFIGSHFVRIALEIGSKVVVLDDLSQSSARGYPMWMRAHHELSIVRGDIGDKRLVRRLAREYETTAIVHFAAKTCVGESVTNPGLYFDHNLLRTHALLEAVRDLPIAFLFSSSAAVYGAPAGAILSESERTEPISAYGMSKLGVEHALDAYGIAHGLRWGALRYFNVAGAHPDGTMRENHTPETHLIPSAIDAALGRREQLVVFGDDHGTPDGTCVRDYVHVMELVEAHVRALEVVEDQSSQLGVVNLGSGHGTSVLEVIQAVERAVGRLVPYSIGERRPGDPARLVADFGLAKEKLGWLPSMNINAMAVDAFRSRMNQEP